VPQKAVPQELFGGLYTEAKPETLPMGASPRAINVDYEVGSVLPRPGKKSAFVYQNFEESFAAFSQSVGPGAPWSTGSVTLNQPGGPTVIGPTTFDKATGTSASGTAMSAGPLTPANPNEWAWFKCRQNGEFGNYLSAIDPAWVPAPSLGPGINGPDFCWQLVSAAVTGNATQTLAGTPDAGNDYTAGLVLLNFIGNNANPTPLSSGGVSVTNGGTFAIIGFGSVVVIGVINWDYESLGIGSLNVNITLTSGNGNNYNFVVQEQSGHTRMVMFVCTGFIGPFDVVTMHTTGPVTAGLSWRVYAEGQGGGGGTGNTSQLLQSMNFSLNLPVNIPQGEESTGCGDEFGFFIPTEIPIYGVEVIVTGNQTSESPDAVLTVQLQFPDGTLSPEIDTIQLPLSSGSVPVGSSTDLWGAPVELNAANLNNPNFTVNIQAFAPGGEQVTFNVTNVTVKVFTPPFTAAGLADFNYLKTFAQTGGAIENLFLGSDGVLYGEDAIDLPGTLTPLFTNILPESFAQSVTLDDREYIAISNLLNGTDIPRTYTPPSINTLGYLDRLSQVGPGAPPSITTTSSGSAIVNITQNPAFAIPTSTGGTNGAWVLWSDSPRDQGSFGLPNTPGNVLTIIFPKAVALPAYITVGSNVVLSGFQVMNGYNPNNGVGGNPAYYTVTSVGQPDPSQNYYDAFTVTLPNSGFYNARIQAGATFQATLATMTTSVQVPNLEVGGQFSLTGTGGAPPAGYDGTYTVVGTPNAAQMTITATSLTNNVATYSYTLITGTAPVAGETVSVGQTLNANGIFNVSNAVITAATPGTFSINLTGPDIPAIAENGTGLVFGTIFTFDPFQIVGNRTGGTVITTGLIIPGQRKVCYSFLTRNGFMTQPSPIDTADIVEGANTIAVANLALGPPNVVARVVHFTAANGGQFYNIPQPVLVIDPITGQIITHSSTWVMDNTSTGASFSFSDSVLLAADEIDIQGNNLFECYELGSCIGFIEYAGRLAAIGEQNKVFNFRNMSFDGGMGITQGNQGAGGGPGSVNQSYPLGWTVDPNTNFGFGGSVVTSPVFGMAYQISSPTSLAQGQSGDIWQPAYQDEFGAPIININTTYSLRVTAMVTPLTASGNLIFTLFSPSTQQTFGVAQIAFAGMSTSMRLFTATLLTTPFATVPQDLKFRIYASNLPNNAAVTIDRVEVYPTEQPNLNNQIILSYANNFESFDRLTGVIKPVDNPQPIKSCYELFETLYMVKTGSMFSTNDNGTTEPVVAGGGWVIKTISQSVGTNSIYGVTAALDQPDTGESWAIVAGRAGAYIYDGGEPTKLSEEIQKLWNTINWQFGHTIWILNDIIQRRILIGVPLKTYVFDPFGNIVRNFWLPEGYLPDDPAPVTPNVILELNYKQLNTAGALASSVGVHRSFAGKLLDSEITRKWSIWTIKAPAAAFLTQADGSNPVFFGNSDHNGKVFELVEGYYQDDDGPYAEDYVTSPFLPRQDAEARQMGPLRCGYSYMNAMLTGEGSCRITVYPNTLDTPYSRRLLPDLPLPGSTNGDNEVPVDEEASRLFVEFGAQCVGSWYILSGLVMMQTPSAFTPFRGVNT
jgi:hypothetical protein